MINIAIAEDDKEDFLLLKEAIETVLPKINIIHSKDGQLFLQSLDDHAEPDLIFLDLNIPKKNGIHCLVALRQQKKLKCTPVIIYSTSLDVEDIDCCYKHGCTLYLVKPPSYKDLVTQVRKIFFRIGLPRENLKFKEMFVVQKQL
ncbi:response regulator [Segetibacter sp. 3557_3]|uniref:response regulator n=1 Tax=Segetibacter sp. 3557_3 TaxID=2547429 RepID=UPI0010587D89|nr:response regulator [Segetibacter sp. 3557_3]TDH29270.1 response regulator [Segetibacter sp. 3557_3]